MNIKVIKIIDIVISLILVAVGVILGISLKGVLKLFAIVPLAVWEVSMFVVSRIIIRRLRR